MSKVPELYRFLLLFLFVTITLTQLPKDNKKSRFRVAQGTISNRNQFPAVAFLYSGKTMCTGSFIARDLIITAAHCMCSTQPMKRVYAGLTSIEEITGKSYVQKYDVKSHIVLPDYEKACDNMKSNIFKGLVRDSDIALLRIVPSRAVTFQEMDEDPEFANSIRNISLGLYPIDFDQSFTIAGFGRDENNALGQLKYGYVVPMKCPENIPGIEKAICHDTRDPFNLQTTLEGDSGGPLLDKENTRVVGVTSGRMEMSSGLKFGVHASVFNNWKSIREAINKLYEGEKPPL